jgi:V8-like Glu-specific endopeptidase
MAHNKLWYGRWVVGLASLLAGEAFADPRPWSEEQMQDATVLLTSVSGGGQQEICSGVAVAPRVILTAAHCTETNNRFRYTFFKRMPRISLRFNEIPRRNIYIHPDYVQLDGSNVHDQNSYVNDISVILLDQPISGLDSFAPLLEQIPNASEVVSSVGVGYGGRDGSHNKFARHMNFVQHIQERGTLQFVDPEVVSGDSGGPVFISTSAGTFVAGVTSTFNSSERGRVLQSTAFADHLEWILRVAGNLLDEDL